MNRDETRLGWLAASGWKLIDWAFAPDQVVAHVGSHSYAAAPIIVREEREIDGRYEARERTVIRPMYVNDNPELLPLIQITDVAAAEIRAAAGRELDAVSERIEREANRA